jgi:hypothetical protein
MAAVALIHPICAIRYSFVGVVVPRVGGGGNLGDTITIFCNAYGTVEQPVSVPGPVAGAGLPGLILICAGFLFAWRRKFLSRRRLAPGDCGALMIETAPNAHSAAQRVRPTKQA